MPEGWWGGTLTTIVCMKYAQRCVLNSELVCSWGDTHTRELFTQLGSQRHEWATLGKPHRSDVCARVDPSNVELLDQASARPHTSIFEASQETKGGESLDSK